jgi:hypothetical protein
MEMLSKCWMSDIFHEPLEVLGSSFSVDNRVVDLQFWFIRLKNAQRRFPRIPAEYDASSRFAVWRDRRPNGTRILGSEKPSLCMRLRIGADFHASPSKPILEGEESPGRTHREILSPMRQIAF